MTTKRRACSLGDLVVSVFDEMERGRRKPKNAERTCEEVMRRLMLVGRSDLAHLLATIG